MNDALKRNIEDRILELQNDGPRYNLYQPVLEEIVIDNHKIDRGMNNGQTMVDHCIETLQYGSSTSFLTKEHYRIFKQCIGTGWPSDAVMKVIGGLLADYYREWKYQNDKLVNVNKCAEIPEPPHHLDRAIAEQNAYYNKPTKQDTTMTIKIENKLFYNGVDIKMYSDDQLFSEIAKAEAEVERLEKIATKPKKLQAKIDELKEGIKALADAIDAR